MMCRAGIVDSSGRSGAKRSRGWTVALHYILMRQGFVWRGAATVECCFAGKGAGSVVCRFLSITNVAACHETRTARWPNTSVAIPRLVCLGSLFSFFVWLLCCLREDSSWLSYSRDVREAFWLLSARPLPVLVLVVVVLRVFEWRPP